MPLGANIYDLISLREAKVVISLNIKQRYKKKSRKSNKVINIRIFVCLKVYLVVIYIILIFNVWQGNIKRD